VGRHMFSVSFILKLLDLLATHKLNKFHWHLTEDQGWRIEIKGLPRLTEIGAWRGTGQARYGGFYSKQDVKQVVTYAAERFIDVVPEIELPGHCKAALACYPELSCSGQAAEVPTLWGIQTDVYCAGLPAPLHRANCSTTSHIPEMIVCSLCASAIPNHAMNYSSSSHGTRAPSCCAFFASHPSCGTRADLQQSHK
jgi:hypothetical protein